MDTLLLIDKPSGWTSFDVVARVRGVVRQQYKIKKPKVGHAGTLDPLATGLLIILVGGYCKRANEFMKLDKVYDVEICLGKVSTTDDGEGEITAVSDKQPTQKELQTAIAAFVGTIQQVPPIFSAIKMNGRRAYALARKGEEVAMKPREVTVHGISDVQYSYPFVRFKAHVSSGTYIRSLARDIGNTLGVGAYMSNLRRLCVAQYSIKNAILPERNKIIEQIERSVNSPLA